MESRNKRERFMQNKSLWNKINDLELSPPTAGLSFESRLARENGWSTGQAIRVISEYKKFLYLAAVSDRMLTPSEAVDQAWHLHLTYTRSYWDNLCAAVLGKPLHHQPTEGGKAEGKKFAAAYEATRDAYRREFGAAPPADVWPPAHIRFLAPRQRWVDARTHIVAPKGPFLAGAASAGLALMAAASPASAAVEAFSDRPFLIAVAVAGAFLLTIVISNLLAGSGGPPRHKDKASGDGGFVYPYGASDTGGKGGKGEAEGAGDSDADGGSGCGSGCGGGCGS